MILKRCFLAAAIMTAAASCTLERAQIAEQAQSRMIGLSRAQLLACAGPPVRQVGSSGTEILTFTSLGRPRTVGPGSISGETDLVTGVAQPRRCEADVTLQNGYVSHVDYRGGSAGLLTRDEACAYIVQRCM